MARSHVVFALSLVVFCLSHRPVLAQGDPIAETGIKPYGAYHGGDIDVVSLVNGKLDLHVPLFSYPQRGSLHLGFTLRYINAKVQVAKLTCLPPTYLCTYGIGGNPGIVEIVPDFPTAATYKLGLPPGLTKLYSLYTDDGAAHELVNTSGTTYESIDATAWQYNTSTNIAIDSSGIRYNLNPSSANLIPSAIEDLNGNEITATGIGWTDSLGRAIPFPPNSTSSGVSVGGVITTDYSGCTGPLTTASASLWNLPGPSGGTSVVKVCFATVNFTFSGTAPSGVITTPSSALLIQSIVLPDDTAWTFQYNNGDLSQITLPTGGTISYTWKQAQLCGTYYTLAGYFHGITSRVVNANDGTGSHSWNYTSTGWNQVTVPTSFTVTILDPANNNSVHTITELGNENCSYYETSAQYYQGTVAPANLLKAVNTAYSATGDPLAQTAFPASVNVVPTQIQTIWANNQVSETDKSYDSGIGGAIFGKVISQNDYDYGSGVHGPLLKRTVYNYQALLSPTYESLNIIDPVASIAVYDSSSNQCKGVANTYCAYTYFGYDESALQSSGVVTQHDSAPPNGNYRGNKTSVHRLLNTSTVAQGPCNVSVSNGYLISSAVFFDTGEVQHNADPCGYQMSYVYSSTYAGSLPTTITNALNLSISNAYDFDTGVLTATTDLNSQSTGYTYDSSWRVTQINYPDGGRTSYSYGATLPISVTATRSITTSLSVVKTSVLDGLGRVHQFQLLDTDCQSTSGLDYVDYGYSYNSTGSYTTVTTPYCSTSDSTYGITTTTDDAIGRVSSIVESDGSLISTTYTGNCTTVTDEIGNARQSCVDGLGRLTGVWEDPGSSPHLKYETDYQYDTLGNMLSVTQKGSNAANARVRSFQYDSLSRLSNATNPESGFISYGYDADGNVITKTAPLANQTGSSTVSTTYGYDVLNRLTSKSYKDGTITDPYTAKVQFGYDGLALSGCTIGPPTETDTYPVGRRTSMCDASGGTSWAHDQMGRVLQERRTIGATAVTKFVDYTYNLDGSVAVLQTPPLKTIRYTYNDAGRQTQAVDSTDSINFALGGTYASPGEWTGAILGSASGFNGFTVSNVYNSRLQPLLLSAYIGTASNAVFSECLDFHLKVAISTPCTFAASTIGDNGNVYQIVNNRTPTRTQNVMYDSLNRIQQSYSSGAIWGETFGSAATAPGTPPTTPGIDAWGNLINRSGVTGKPNTEPLSTSAGTNNQLSGFSYDAAGNMTLNGSVSYTYDAENRLVWTSGYRYIYDGNGERVEKCAVASVTTACPTSGTTGILYWKGTGSETLDETDLGGNPQEEYIFFAGERIARRDVSSGGTTIAMHYYFSDHLGSHGVIENATGTICEQDVDYYPYGGVQNDYCAGSGVSQNYKFTGKERDAESGLDNFGARYNTSTMGRFMTPDPLYLELHRLIDPQRLNLYAYVRNNPLNMTDATGLDITCTGDKCANYLVALQKDVSFKIDYDKNGKVETVGDIDKKSLSKSDKAFLSAIDDSKHHVTINAVGGDKDSSVFFGASHGATHTINFDQAALLDSSKNAGGMTSAGLVGHETLEGYDESKGYSMSEGHDYATGLGFPGLDPGRITGLFGNAQTGTAYGFTQQFQVHGTGTTENIRINFVTPIPATSVHSGMNAAGYPVSVEKAQ